MEEWRKHSIATYISILMMGIAIIILSGRLLNVEKQYRQDHPYQMDHDHD
jgi:hypothetical protein